MEATMDTLVLYDNLVFGLFAAYSREKQRTHLLYSSVGLSFAIVKIVMISQDLLSQDLIDELLNFTEASVEHMPS